MNGEKERELDRITREQEEKDAAKAAKKAGGAEEKRRQNPIPMEVVETEDGTIAQMVQPKVLGIDWPGERIPASDKKYWYLAFALWILGWIAISLSIRKLSLLVTLVYCTAFLTWLLLFCIKTIPENYRAKPVLFGVIGKKVSFGTVLILAPFEKLILFPTGIQQITLSIKPKKDEDDVVDKEKKSETGAGIQTKAGKDENGRALSSIVLPVDPVLNFRWPSKDEELTETIKNAPPPDDLDALKNIIEEPILDIIRTVGGQETYLWITQNRTKFSTKVNEEMEKNENLVKLVKLAYLRNFSISFAHMRLPDKLKEAQVEEAAAPYTSEALKIKKIKEGEGSKEFIMREGEGTAYTEALVRTKILDVLTDAKYKDVAVLLEQLKAFTEASKTGKTTVVVPSDILNMLGSSLGKVSGKKEGMSIEEIAAMIMPVLQQLVAKEKEGK